MTLITGAWTMNANAQIVETDMTGQFSSLTNWRNWTGASGYTATNFCPMVTVGGGIGQKQVCEKYEGTCASTGDVFYATVTGLTAGTYKIELYGGAAYTFGRGFSSTAFSEGTWNAGDKIEPSETVSTGVTLYAQSEGVTYGGEIPIYYATDFPDGAATVTIEGVVVGTSGQIKIGMSKTSTSTNWHVIQLKSVIAQVDLSDLVAAKKAELQAIVDEGSPYVSYSADLQTALETAQGYINTDVSTDATAAQQLITNMDASIAALPALITAAKNAQSVDGASASNPIVTDFVVNGDFSTNGVIAPWKCTGGFQNQTTANNQQGAFTGNFFENWNPSAKVNKMYQDIANIPNGVYKLSICAFVNTFGGTQYVFANSAQTALTTGTPTAYEVFVEVTNNAVQIGLEQTTATANWMGIDNVSLTYYGNCTIEEAQFGSLVQDLADLKAQIRAITAVPQALIDADEVTLNSYDPSTYTTAAQYEAAITDLQAVLAARQAAETSYAKLTELKGYVTSLLAVDYIELVSGAHATLEAASTDESGLTTAAAVEQAYTDLKDATMTYVANADPVAGEQFDLTFMLVNPDVTSFWTGAWGVVPSGWYTDQNPADNFQVMANDDMGPGGEVFIEYWSGSAKTSNFVLYQKATLPEGTYKMTGRVGLLQSDAGTPKANMTFSANDTDGSQIAVGPLSDQEVEFINTTTQEVKIGLKAQAGNTYHWIGINKIHMYKIPTDNTEYAIGVDATNATVNVTVEGVAAAAAKNLDAVNYTITLDASCTLVTHTVTYVDGDNNTQTITPTDLGEGQYTFQMPAFDVTITVVATVDKSALAAAIAGAAPYLNEALPAAIMTALNDANTAAQDVYDDADATAAQVSAATDALNFTVLDVQNAISSYAAYLELKPYADALVRVANDNATANGALADAISDAEDAVSGATGYAEIDDANEALRAAMDTYAAAANPVGDGAKFNLTYMFVNPNLEGLPTWQPCDGWSTEQTDGNSQVIAEDERIWSEDGTKKAVYEYWSYTAKSNGLFTLYQPVTLPAGYYEMSCYAFAKQQDDPANTGDVKGVFFYANDTQGTVVDTDRLSQKSIEFKNRTAQEVKIGLKAINPNSYNWMGIGYLELYKIPSKTLIIDQDDDEYDITKAGAYDVTLLRPIKAAYNTLVLPFSMTQQEIEDAFGQDSKVSYLKGYNAAANALSFTSKNDAGEPLGLIANRPCLLKATEPIDEGTPIEIEGRTVIASENDLPAYTVLTKNANDEIIGEATMYGTYQGEIDVPDYCWFVQGGQLVYAPGNNTHCWINMTRAYIELKDGEGNPWTPDPSGVKALTITFDDEEATGIAVVENGELRILDGQAYDLSGRAVKNPTKGLYIINGQKVFLK